MTFFKCISFGALIAILYDVLYNNFAVKSHFRFSELCSGGHDLSLAEEVTFSKPHFSLPLIKNCCKIAGWSLGLLEKCRNFVATEITTEQACFLLLLERNSLLWILRSRVNIGVKCISTGATIG